MLNPFCKYQSTLVITTVQHSTAQHSTMQYSTVQYSTVQYSTVQYSTAPVQYSTTLVMQYQCRVAYSGALYVSSRVYTHLSTVAEELHDVLRVVDGGLYQGRYRIPSELVEG